MPTPVAQEAAREPAAVEVAGTAAEARDERLAIRRCARPSTLFYLDPPYYGGESDYGAAFLSAIVSTNDVPEMRRTFAGFRLQPVELNYTVRERSGRSGNVSLRTPWAGSQQCHLKWRATTIPAPCENVRRLARFLQ